VNIKFKLILGIIGIFILIFLWDILVVVELHKIPTDYEIILEQEGHDRALNAIGEDLSDPFQLRETFREKVVNSEGNILEIYSTILGKNSETGEIIFDSRKTYFVDRDTKKHLKEVEGYFSFPENVKKQNYELFHPIVLGPATFVFEEVEIIRDLEVYIFSCESFGNDVSYAFQKFKTKKIIYDGKCRTAIEPVTGSTINFELDWDIYFVEDGVRGDQVELGGKKSTEYSQFNLVEHAKTLKQLHFFYETIIPILIMGIFSAVLVGIIIVIEKIKSDFLNIQKTTKLEKIVKEERLTAIGEMSANIAHDIRNPLSVIKTSNEIMKKIVHDEEGINEINRIDRSIARMTHQLNQILDFLRKTPLKLEKFSLTHILKGAIKAMEIPPNISINMPQDDFEVMIDRSKMESVFYNIIFNAIQAIKNQKGTIAVRASEEGDMIKLEFENDGPNISDEVLSKIFEPLFTTKQKGTGLGLSAAKISVEQHGGTISITNNPVIFTIKLPKKNKI